MPMNDSSPAELDPKLKARSTIAKALHDKRQADKLGQKDVAQAAGVSLATVSNAERGNSMARSTLLAIARALGIQPEVKAQLDAMEAAHG